MKKATVFAAALALVLSLAACGNKDNNGQTAGGNQTNGTAENGGPANGSSNGSTTNSENGGSVTGGTGSSNGTQSGGTSNGSGVSGSLTEPNGSTGTGTGTGTENGTGTGTGSTTDPAGQSRSRVGSDLRSAADHVGDAVSDMVDSGRNALSRVTSANTTFEQMLDNARVRDTDGVLSDGENSRW